MNDTYHEQIVAKKGNGLTVSVRILIFIFLAFLLLVSLIQPFLIVAFIAFAGVSFYYILPRMNIEYEYSCLNSEFSIDAIFSKSSRKHITGFDLRSVEKFTRKENMNPSQYGGAKILDFTGETEMSNNYALLIAEPGSKRVILLSLNHQMLETAKMYVPKYSFEV